jgi:hypothetical protein
MTDFVLITGDTVMFNPTFGQAIVVVQPGTLNGTGKDNVDGKLVCVEGDEATVRVLGCAYQTPQYSIPGVGMLSIASLGADQTAKRTKAGGKAVLLKGSVFNAKFEVMVPAQQPPPGPSSPTPDSTPQYSGTGSFVTTNVRVQGT